MVQRRENQTVRKEKSHLELYLDNLLVRVMEVQPLILQHPSQRLPPSNTASRLTQSEKQTLMLDVARLTPCYPPPAYSQPRTDAQTPAQARAKTPAKPGRTTSSTTTTSSANLKRERKSNNPFKRFSSAFK